MQSDSLLYDIHDILQQLRPAGLTTQAWLQEHSDLSAVANGLTEKLQGTLVCRKNTKGEGAFVRRIEIPSTRSCDLYNYPVEISFFQGTQKGKVGKVKVSSLTNLSRRFKYLETEYKATKATVDKSREILFGMPAHDE